MEFDIFFFYFLTLFLFLITINFDKVNGNELDEFERERSQIHNFEKKRRQINYKKFGQIWGYEQKTVNL